MTLTVAYTTCRLDCRWAWFRDSLHRELAGDYRGVRVVCVDYWKQPHPSHPPRHEAIDSPCPDFHWVAPKPTVWQGPARLTSRDYFAPANAHNTAICLAPDGHLAFVDDVSVLTPGWLGRVRAAVAGGYVACGAYRKVFDLRVDDGEVLSFRDCPGGHDHRLALGEGVGPRPCGGGWMYGCNLVAPVDALLAVNGYPEACDAVGGEDYVCGLAVERGGYELRYDPLMMTLEDEGLHAHPAGGPSFCRADKGQGRDSKSWRLLLGHGTQRRFENYFGECGIAALRAAALAGGAFPPAPFPEHDWYDAQPLREM